MRSEEPSVVDFRECLRSHRSDFRDRVALDDGSRVVTYGELPTEIEKWQSELADLDAERVAFRLPNGIDWATLDLALLLSGRIAIPVPEFFSPDQQVHLVRVSGADTFVASSSIACSTSSDLVGLDGEFTVKRDSWRSMTLQPDPGVTPPPKTAKITFTSGSTGTPRGVCLAADTMIDTARSLVDVLDPLAIRHHLSLLPLSLLLENVAGLYASLLNGSTVSLPPLESIGLTGSSQIDIERFIEGQLRYQPESLVLVPQLLLVLTAARELDASQPARYRFIAVGGAKVAPSLMTRARKAGLPVYEGYGLTECGSVVTLNRPGADRPGTVGQPLPHVQLTVRSNEVFVSSPHMLGYLDSDSSSPDDDGIATGDSGSLSTDNYLTLHGRCNNLIVTSFGRNLSPEWVESELQAEIEIGTAIVFGHAQPENIALIAPRMNADAIAVARAVERCNARLPDYARIGRWHVVDVDALRAANCLTPNGRPRRQAIESRYARLIRVRDTRPSQPSLSHPKG